MLLCMIVPIGIALFLCYLWNIFMITVKNSLCLKHDIGDCFPLYPVTYS